MAFDTQDTHGFGQEPPVHDFCLVQDRYLVEEGLAASDKQVRDYGARIEAVYQAQLFTPDTITGNYVKEYLLVKSTFDTVLARLEQAYSLREQQFEDFNSDLVQSGSPRVARQVSIAIAAYREEDAQSEASFDLFASELFRMQHDPAYKTFLVD